MAAPSLQRAGGEGSSDGEPMGQLLERHLGRSRASLHHGAAGRRGRARAGLHGRAGRPGSAPPPGRLHVARAARGTRRWPAAGAGARRADAAGGHQSAAGAAPRRAAAVLRTRDRVPGLRLPPPPGAGRTDGRRAPRGAARNHMFIRLIPLISLVDNSTSTRRVHEAAEQVDCIFTEGSNHRVRFAARVLDITEIRVQGARKLCNVREHPSLGIVGTQDQKTLDNKELVDLCMLTVENYPGFTEFSYFQIMEATDNFSEKRYLGSGGFETAYKGQLPQGFVVGIKRFDNRATLSDFSNELQLARLRYTNIIRLLGWCIHGEERILIYKFMQNGSLDRHIFVFQTG
ncbi:hypothetical protein ACQJBY_066088 [Aegilops geniculata]